MKIKNKIRKWTSWIRAKFNIKRAMLHEGVTLSPLNFHSVLPNHWGSAMGGRTNTQVFIDPIKYIAMIKLIAGPADEPIQGCDWKGNKVFRNFFAMKMFITLVDKTFSCNITFDKGTSWASFWLLGRYEDNYQEVDLFETFHKPNKNGMMKLKHTHHWGDTSSTGRKASDNYYWIRSHINDDATIVRFKVIIAKTIKLYANGFLVNEIKNPFNNSPSLIFSNGNALNYDLKQPNTLMISNMKVS